MSDARHSWVNPLVAKRRRNDTPAMMHLSEPVLREVIDHLTAGRNGGLALVAVPTDESEPVLWTARWDDIEALARLVDELSRIQAMLIERGGEGMDELSTFGVEAPRRQSEDDE